MKFATILSITVILAAGSSQVLAGGHHDGKHHKRGWQAVHHKAHHDKGRHYSYRKHHKRQHMKHRTAHQRWKHHHRHYRGHDYYRPYRPWRHHRHHRWHYRPYDYYPSLFGAGVVGAVIGHHLYHTHDGNVCYEDHGDDRGRHGKHRDAGYSEVVGCHRIEELPNGNQRRVEVPISECR